MKFEWDDTKSERNKGERGFGFELGALIFEGDTLEWPDERAMYGETRVRALGQVNDAILHVVFTDRGDARRIISVRVANKQERIRWHANQ